MVPPSVGSLPEQQAEAAMSAGWAWGAVLAGLVAGSAMADQPARLEPRMTAKEIGNIRDRRYCEIFVIKAYLAETEAQVFNTLGLNDCPAEQWQAIDPGLLKKELGAQAIVMNGPRHFVMDWIQSRDMGERPVELGGLEMRPVARIVLPVADGKVERRAYTDHVIERSTSYVYAAGEKVYELISPAKRVYVMQAYAQTVDPKLSIDQLASLGDRLKLPDGWSYRVRTLDQDLELRTNGKATVVQDELQNTYQRFELRFDAG
jgi:hypothetical protein